MIKVLISDQGWLEWWWDVTDRTPTSFPNKIHVSIPSLHEPQAFSFKQCKFLRHKKNPRRKARKIPLREQDHLQSSPPLTKKKTPHTTFCKSFLPENSFFKSVKLTHVYNCVYIQEQRGVAWRYKSPVSDQVHSLLIRTHFLLVVTTSRMNRVLHKKPKPLMAYKFHDLSLV